MTAAGAATDGVDDAVPAAEAGAPDATVETAGAGAGAVAGPGEVGGVEPAGVGAGSGVRSGAADGGSFAA
jgi:hypothetical protein